MTLSTLNIEEHATGRTTQQQARTTGANSNA